MARPIYERGLPKEWRLQPVGEARGMTMHESQSLMIEMQASRSRDFLTFLAPLAREAFGGRGPAWQADNLLRHYTAVKPDYRSEERRVGKECVSTCRSRGSSNTSKKK